MEDHHYDFTTVSDLEVFISALEDLIQRWGVVHKGVERPLEEDDFISKEWCFSSERVRFKETDFNIVRHYLKCETESQDEIRTFDGEQELIPQAIQDIMSNKNDFVPFRKPHPIARWYGLRDFIILIPDKTVCVGSESIKKVMLSTITIAISNAKCKVPVFYQGMEPWQNYFTGVFQSGSFKTDFSMVHLKNFPKDFREYSGLLYLFKTKISEEKTDQVKLSVRHTYVLKEWVYNGWTKNSLSLELLFGNAARSSERFSLPFGSNYDPVKEISLITIWPLIPENLLFREQFNGQDDLDPIKAPIWKVSVSRVENLCCLLTDHFIEFVALTRNRSSISELLGNLIRSNQTAGPSDLSSPLNVLTESRITAFSKAVIGVDKGVKNEGKEQTQQAKGPISSEYLMAILYYLFPDATSDPVYPYSENLGGKLSVGSAEEEHEKSLDKRLSKMKSAPYDGLLWRLSIVLSHLIYWNGGIRSAAYVWYEFVQELRFRWENGILVPGLEPGSPDCKTCLLNQKLQLLNCCISRRIEREQHAAKRKEGEFESDEEEEFYDCSAEISDDENEDEGEGEGERRAKIPPWDKPIGRLMKHGELKLLETGAPLYIPHTQGPVPKTEDQVEEYAEFLLKLGSDDMGSKMRAKIMSASLLSDMEAFKAANPGCILSDFIRWYSPRDWIEEDEVGEFGQKKGHLSDRMNIPGNTWLEVWEVAQPVPAMCQRRLFNDTRESEKVLDFLEQRSPKEFLELLLPVMSTCVIQRLLEEPLAEDLPGTSEPISKLIKKAEKFGKDGKTNPKRYEDLIDYVQEVESSIACARFLEHIFTASLGEDDMGFTKMSEPDLMNFIRKLLAGEEAEIPGAANTEISSKICCHFIRARKGSVPSFLEMSEEVFNAERNPHEYLKEKEIILRLNTSHGPQRFHATFKNNDYRICGAFTENIYYKYAKKQFWVN